MEEVLKILIQLKTLGLIGGYAIGGGVATILNSREFSTKDLDVFTTLPKSGGLIDLGPVWRYLQEKERAEPMGQFIVVNGIPIDFVDPRQDFRTMNT